MASERSAILKRVGMIVLIGAGLWFAVQAGEFGTLDLYRQGRRKAAISKSLDSLKVLVDSLKKYEDKVEHDPATQERIAREMFGMVRGNKEVLYRFADPPDTTRKTP